MDQLLSRQVPHSVAAEQSVVGSMLIDPSCIPDVIEKVKAEEFYIQTNREIFETIYAMFSYNKTIDPVTVEEEMKVRGVHRADSTHQYLLELMQITPTAANVLKYAAIVRDRALRTRSPSSSPTAPARPTRSSRRQSARSMPCGRTAPSAACSRCPWCCSACTRRCRRSPSTAARSPA